MIAIAPAPVWWRLALALLGVATFAGAGAAAAEAQPLPANPVPEALVLRLISSTGCSWQFRPRGFMRTARPSRTPYQ